MRKETLDGQGRPLGRERVLKGGVRAPSDDGRLQGMERAADSVYLRKIS